MGTSEDLQVEIRNELRRLSSVIEGALGEDGQVAKNKSQIGKNTAAIRVWSRICWIILTGMLAGLVSLMINAAIKAVV